MIENRLADAMHGFAIERTRNIHAAGNGANERRYGLDCECARHCRPFRQ
jgi:hypothetical protein